MSKSITKKVSLSSKSLAAALYNKETYENFGGEVDVYESVEISSGYSSISLDFKEAKKLAEFINKVAA